MRCADKRPGCAERLSDPKAEGEGGGGSGRPRRRPCTPLSASGLRLGRRRWALKMTESESDPISDMQLRTAAYKGVQDGRTPHTLRMARPEGSEANRCSPPLDGGQKQ